MEYKLLDVYAGAGGCSMGYFKSGFTPYGIDHDPKPLRHYPFPHLCMDVLEALERLIQGEGLTFSNGEMLYLKDFAVIHASPPCQRSSRMTKRWGRQNSHPEMISPTRELLKIAGKLYVIENVVDAPLENPVMLCGSMFGLHSQEYHLRRHRLFETNITFFAPAPCNHQKQALPVYGHAGGSSKRDGLKFPGVEAWREGMQIDWMTQTELAESIPPAYTEFIGKQLLTYLEARQCD